MKVVIVLIAALWVMGGLWFFLSPKKLRSFQEKIFKFKYIRSLGLLPLVIGLLLFYSAKISILSWLIQIVAILAITKGVFFLLAPGKTRDALIFWWLNTSEKLIRILGFLILILGIIVLMSVA